MAGAVKRQQLRAAGLALPLVAFIGVTFAIPLAMMLVRSVYDPVVADAMPETLARLGEWDGGGGLRGSRPRDHQFGPREDAGARRQSDQPGARRPA